MNTPSSRPVQSVIMLLIVTGLIAMALGGYLTPVTRLVLRPFLSTQTWLSTRFRAAQDFISAPSDLVRLRQRNTDLEAEVARLQSQVVDLQQQISEVQILSALLDFARANPEYQYQAASVIGRDYSPFIHYVYIDKGADNGLRRGMPAVTQQGLVGHIVSVTAEAARVQLINDPGSSINIRLQPSGAEAVLTGDITGDITLNKIPQDASIQAGELVLTSGLGGNFPPNIRIGQVTGVRSRSADIFQSASVQPLVDFSHLEIVLVITNFKPVDITPLVPTPSVP